MTFPPSVRGVLCAALALGAALALTSCSSDTLQQRHTVTIGSTQIVDASASAALRGRRVTLMVPSGRVDLTLTAPVRTVAAEDVGRAAPIRATKGRSMVGVSWLLQRAAYPDSPNRQLSDPYPIFGVPQPVHLWLVTDGTRRAIPRVENLAEPAGRPSTAVWLSVPAGVHTWQFALDYDGVTQTVDARTGRVSAGRAAPLYRALPLNAGGVCDLGGKDVYTSCLTEYAIGYPYITGVGWAPAGRTWALLQVTLKSDFGGAQHVTVAGAAPRPEVGDVPDAFTPFLVSATATRFAVRGHEVVTDLDGHSVRAPLTATLYRSRP